MAGWVKAGKRRRPRGLNPGEWVGKADAPERRLQQSVFENRIGGSNQSCNLSLFSRAHALGHAWRGHKVAQKN